MKRKRYIGGTDQEEAHPTIPERDMENRARKVVRLCFLDHSGVTGKTLHQPIIVDHDFLDPETFNINDPLRGDRADL